MFARDFGESKANVHGWVKAITTPSLPVLLKLSQFFDVPVEDIILGNQPDTCIQGLKSCAPELLERKRRKPSEKIDREIIGGSLEEEIKAESPSRTLETIAEALNVDKRTLRKLFPHHCDAIAKRTQARIKDEARTRFAARQRHYLETHARLSRAIGRSAPRRKVLEVASKYRYERAEAHLLHQQATKRFHFERGDQ